MKIRDFGESEYVFIIAQWVFVVPDTFYMISIRFDRGV